MDEVAAWIMVSPNFSPKDPFAPLLNWPIGRWLARSGRRDEVVLATKIVKRNVPIKNLKREDVEKASSFAVRQTITLQQGVPMEIAKEIVKFIKDAKLKKVQAQIQGEQVRVISPSRDELQNVMQLLRGHDFKLELSFGNFRSQ